MHDSTPGTPSQYESGGTSAQTPANPDPPGDEVSLCPNCAAQMPETSAFCPACGRSIEPPPRGEGSVGIFRENFAGALAYFTFIPAVLFLVLEPYKRNRFVRFHSAQCLLVWAGATLAAVFLYAIPVAGPLFVVLIAVVAALFGMVMWLVLLVKALQGEMFKLPLLGDIAEKHASAI
jgi:uncharacterized membrane protein